MTENKAAAKPRAAKPVAQPTVESDGDAAIAPTPSSSMFGITTETKSKNNTPFQPTDQNPITLGYLVDVKRDTRELKAGGSKEVVVFEFRDIEKVRTHYHTEWELDPTDDDFETRMNGMKSRIKHIYEEFQAFPTNGIGATAQNFDEFFDAVITAFSTNGKEGTPIYKDIKIWVKVTYNIKSGAKAQLGFPLSPNFIERWREGKPTTLWVNKKYETLKQPESKAAAVGLPDNLAEQASGEFPTFAGQ